MLDTPSVVCFHNLIFQVKPVDLGLYLVAESGLVKDDFEIWLDKMFACLFLTKG